MKTTYKTFGTCARFIDIELDGDKIIEVKFIGGCAGNAKGIAKLLEGMDIHDVIPRFKGIACQGNTSCPDQLAQALEAILMKKAS
ncbi:MAG: TIGR03905 family TSCPD domain-containing protein [Desulfuromonas sp.]|nr:TIGR03905 family TSCPD domain-containing protein [Desulfuromonas sp.]